MTTAASQSFGGLKGNKVDAWRYFDHFLMSCRPWAKT